MKISFAPLQPDAIEMLSVVTGIDFRQGEFDNEVFWFCCTARRDDGSLMGVLVGEFKNPYDVYCTYAILDPRCVSRRLMRAVFEALFSRAVRIPSQIEPSNAHAMSMADRMGFQFEGYMRKAIEGRYDAVMLGMLREDCRFLPGYRRPRQRLLLAYPTHPEPLSVN